MIMLVFSFVTMFSFVVAWDGSFTEFIGNNKFCDCGFGNKCANFICAGGGASGGGANCPVDACTSGQYSFSQEEGWAIKIDKIGGPYRAFAYMPFCGENMPTSSCWTTNPQTFAFQFKINVLPSGPWPGSNKILFWGDGGHDLMNILPNTYDIAIFPQGDAPPNAWTEKVTISPGVWNKVVISFDISTTGTSVTISVNGGTPIAGTINNVWTSNNYLMIGSYAWTSNANGKTMQLNFKDLCLGTGNECPKFQDSTPVVSPGITLAPTTLAPTTDKLAPTTLSPTTLSPTTGGMTGGPASPNEKLCACNDIGGQGSSWCSNSQDTPMDLYMTNNCQSGMFDSSEVGSYKVGTCLNGKFSTDPTIVCGQNNVGVSLTSCFLNIASMILLFGLLLI